jgi:hypothetical protein
LVPSQSQLLCSFARGREKGKEKRVDDFLGLKALTHFDEGQ